MVFRGKVGCPRNSAVLASRGWRHGTAGRGPWGCPALHRLQEHRAIMEGHRQPPWHWSVCSCVPPTPTHTAVNLLRQHPAFYSCSCCFDCLPALPQWPEKRFFPLIAAWGLLAKGTLLLLTYAANSIPPPAHVRGSPCSAAQPLIEHQPPSGVPPGTGANGGWLQHEVWGQTWPPLPVLEMPMSSHEAFLRSHTGAIGHFPTNKPVLLMVEQAWPARFHVSLSVALLIHRQIKATQFAWERLKVESSPCCQAKNCPVKHEGCRIPPVPAVATLGPCPVAISPSWGNLLEASTCIHCALGAPGRLAFRTRLCGLPQARKWKC